MAAFYWSIGPAQGSAQIMLLTIVGEVTGLQVTSRSDLGNQPVPVQGFQPCIPTQTVPCGPVPLVWLPLTANAFVCGAAGDTPQIVPTATSPSPTDPNTNGANPFCAALTSGGTVLTTPGGGGSATTPKDMCDAAQNSAALTAARTAFESACGMLRSDQANAAVYVGLAAAFEGAAVTFTIASAATGLAFWVAIAFAILAIIFGGLAILFSALAGEAASRVASDESLLDSAQKAWESAIAAVRNACCPAWITINTADLVCA